MIRNSKMADERREAGLAECWCLHGAVGAVSDWRNFASLLASEKTGSRAVDLWRFLEAGAMPANDFARAFNAEAAAEPSRGAGRFLLGYSMGGRLALHALLEHEQPWQAAVIVSAHPGLENPAEREARRGSDAAWAARALTSAWPDFLTAWNGQAVLGGPSIRSAEADARLALRRGEIARSFVDWSLGAQQPLWERLAEIRVPVLWVAGENDEKFRALAERAAALIPQCRLALAPGCGHRVPWEAEAWLARETAAFFRSGG